MSADSLLKKFSWDVQLYFSETFDWCLAKPLWVYISISHACTYRCQMCSVVNVLQEHTLDTATVKKVLEEIARWEHVPTVVFTGGETFLQKDIFELIAFAVSRGIPTEAVSNGSLIDQHLASRIIASGLSNIAVSLDGACPSTHDHIRQRGAFAQACIAITLLAEAKKLHGSGPQISVWTTIMKENVAELSSIIPVVKARGVECLVYHPVIAAQVDMQHTSNRAAFWVSSDEQRETLAQEIDKLAEYSKAHGLIAFLHDPHLWLRYFDGTLTRKDWKCNPYAFISIGPDGEVRSCGTSFGSIKKQSLQQCMESRQAGKVRYIMKQCAKPCLQTCWANPDSDSLEKAVRVLCAGVRKEKLGPGEQKRVMRQAMKIMDGYKHVCEEKCKD